MRVNFGEFILDGSTITSSDGDDIINYGSAQWRFTPVASEVLSVFSFSGNDEITLSNAPDGYFEYYGGRPKRFYVESSFGSDLITGGKYSDTIYSGHGRDVVYGKDGNDAIRSGHGHDVIYGGNGSDFLWGGVGQNTIDPGINDNAIDSIFVPVDSIQNKDNGNPGGVNADVINNLGYEDKIYLHGSGISSDSVKYAPVNFMGSSGMGIHVNDILEAVITGGFSAEEVESITSVGFYPS